MKALLAYCRAMDTVSGVMGWIAAGCVLASCLISAGNALVRYVFDLSSNGWLEIQWYLFAATVMLGGALVMRLNEHVRVDIFYSRLKGRQPVFLDLAGLALFVIPVMYVQFHLSWPLFVSMWTSGEVSSNAGGLVRWPAMLLLPLGFLLMILQAVAEIIKRLALLGGRYAMDTHYEKPLQ